MWLCNAFSPEMLSLDRPVMVRFTPTCPNAARAIAAQGVQSAVGHASTAQVLSARLGVQVPVQRVNVSLAEGDQALVAQLSAGRLPEGEVLSAEEISSIPIRWILIEVTRRRELSRPVSAREMEDVVWLCNAFSAGMLPSWPVTVRFAPLNEWDVQSLARQGIRSAVGHQSTADVLARRLGVPVPVAHIDVSLLDGDQCLIAQLGGGRLPEGRVLTDEESAGVPIRWVLVEVTRA